MARRPVPGEGHDPSRREFFRTFTRQTVQNAGAVVGAANELQRTSLAAARELLEDPGVTSGTRPGVAPAQPSAAATTFRSAYRFTGDSIVLLDQRELPERVMTFEAREPSEIAAAIRVGAVTAGPVLGELAAYAVALAAGHAASRTQAGRDQLVRAAAGTLRGARPDVRALGVAVDRMEGRYDALAAGEATATAIAEGLSAEANAISAESATAHARVGRLAADALGRDALGPLGVLVHGDAGPLSCGLVGMATTCFRAMLDAGADLHVWVTDAAPTREGARVSAFQLAQSDIPHTVVPDTAVGRLLRQGAISAVLLRADTVAANGDVVALLGALQVAQLAQLADVPVTVLAPRISFSSGLSDVSSLPTTTSAIPSAEVVPSSLVSTLVTEEAD